MSTFLVTGGNGFIGSYVTRRLIADGHKVIILDHQTNRKAPEGAELFLGDIRDASAMTEAMAHAEGFIHLAGVLGTAETIDNPRPAAETNVIGGLNVLEAAAQYNVPGVNIAVGNHWEQNTYSITKSTVERFVDMFNRYRGSNFTIVRALNAYGPGQSVAAPYGDSKVRKIMPSFCCRALSGHDVEVYASETHGSSVMDMIYVADVADILVEALYYTRNHGHAEGVVEAGTGRWTTVEEIANEVVKQAGSGQVKLLPMRRGETHGAVVMGDPKTLSYVGYDSSRLTSLEDGISKTLDYYRGYLNDRNV